MQGGSPLCEAGCGRPTVGGASLCPPCMLEGKVPQSVRVAARRAIEKKRPAYEKWLPADGSTPDFKPMEERAHLYPDNFERWTKHGELILGEGGYRSQAAVKAALMGLMAICEREQYRFSAILREADESLDQQWAQDDHRRERGFRGIMLDELAAREIERASLRREREAKKKNGK